MTFLGRFLCWLKIHAVCDNETCLGYDFHCKRCDYDCYYYD